MSVASSVTASTRVFALLGDPVAQSLSPRIHNAAFRECGLDGVYVAMRCSSSDAGALLRAIAHSGGGGNVTVPHKMIAAGVLDRQTAAVARTGACNTFWFEDGLVCGDNTDVEGFRRALTGFAPDLTGARVLLLGAGGAARAVVAALDEMGAGRIDVVNRTSDRAARLKENFASSTLSLHLYADAGSLRRETFDLVVNATSLGLHDQDSSPLDVAAIGVARAVMDLVYASHETPFLAEARVRGIPAQDGREMLLHQAAAAFERWYPVPAPLDIMRGALNI